MQHPLIHNGAFRRQGSNPCELSHVLNSALRKSAASWRDKAGHDETVSRLSDALGIVHRLLKNEQAVRVTAILEPTAVAIKHRDNVANCDIELLAPRLIAQCTMAGQISPARVTLTYTPLTATRIALRASDGERVHASPFMIQWTSLTSSWSIAGHGPEIDAESHASLVRSALVGCGLLQAA